MSANNESASNQCVVCYKDVDIYSIGMCDHPVCFECSTRMRVLCQQNECPICRQELPKVVFTREIKSFRHLRKGNLVDTKYSIYFQNDDIQDEFANLLANKCTICPDKQMFGSFNSLKDHMNKKHDLHYCDLCVDNLKIFAHERRSYTRSDLSRHRRKGDLDDKSHKGHPICQFCERRYMDNDELFRHLRKDHLFCHFCDADGYHQYYDSYTYLRNHFMKDHYLCEEGDCAEEKFTSVFRTDIDLKAHIASTHGRHLGKAAAKQARTLELEFTLAPREARNRRSNPRDYDGTNHLRNSEFGASSSGAQAVEERTFVRQPLVDVQSTEEFPTLGNATSSYLPKTRGNVTIRSTVRPQTYDENFPALGPEATPSVSKTVNLSVTNTPAAVGGPNFSIRVNHRPKERLVQKGVTGSKIWINSGNSTRHSDFPALGGAESSSSNPETVAQWTKVTCVKKKSQGKKVATPPLAPSPPPIDDFPRLSEPTTLPVPSWVQFPSRENADATKGKAKKKKMKQVVNGNGSCNNEISSRAKTKDKKKLEQEKKSDSSETSSSNECKKQSSANEKERKRSELKIDGLNSTEQDFPALSGPPPGFGPPPPGFFSQPNSLTFTNSSGESYPILPETYSYQPPHNFKQRNRDIITKINSYFKHPDSEEFNDFRLLSIRFRSGYCNAEDYYDQSRIVMGANAFQAVFPELLALLPDIEKQRALFEVLKNKHGKPKCLDMCHTCGQILMNSDLQSHLSVHKLENHFPSISKPTPSEQQNNRWARK